MDVTLTNWLNKCFAITGICGFASRAKHCYCFNLNLILFPKEI